MKRAENRRQKSEDRRQNAGTPPRFQSFARCGGSPVSCLLFPGFSLLELMIAIVILGIGMVMVATIFPIGIDMAAQTVQMNIAQSVADAALATLKLKVPSISDLTGDSVASYLVFAPDVTATDLDTVIDNSANNNDVLALALSGKKSGPPPPPLTDWMPVDSPWVVEYGPPGLNIASYLTGIFPAGGPPKVRLFTETTGWTGEKGASGPGGAWDYAYVIPSQNLLLNYLTWLSQGKDPRSSMIPPTLGQVPDVYPVNLVDQVYPPVPLIAFDPKKNEYKKRLPADFIPDVAGRRYSWIGIHHVTDPTSGRARFVVTILVTHRSSLTNRYARQAEPSQDKVAGYNPRFIQPDDRRELRLPKPDMDSRTDMLFPHPWLVRFDQINLGTGEVRCTQAVADLLPPGSYFVAARSVYAFNSSNEQIFPAALAAGTAYEVSARQGQRGNPDDIWTLQIRRQPPVAGAASEWIPENPSSPRELEIPYAWVVSPAVERVGTGYSFQAKSPVAGVFVRMVE
ncbi:MAG TPA: type II secretion system protein [Phycisphaerae bacterium]|nr:type II secretion system protein [Phycisphaerae bacterium]HRR86029.1 type II secretion system protein [Phycisphaerae bacterium]